MSVFVNGLFELVEEASQALVHSNLAVLHGNEILRVCLETLQICQNLAPLFNESLSFGSVRVNCCLTIILQRAVPASNGKLDLVVTEHDVSAGALEALHFIKCLGLLGSQEHLNLGHLGVILVCAYLLQE